MVSFGRTLGLAAALTLGAATGIAQQSIHTHIFPDVSAAHGDVTAAFHQARKEHKRVLLDFGGDWCPDCQILNLYFHQPENLDLLNQHYVLVDVNIGRQDTNLDIAQKYGIDVTKGVPALAVLTPGGKVLYGKEQSAFRDARNMQSSDVHKFLEQWK